MECFSRLLCGENNGGSSEIDLILQHLGESIEKVLCEISDLSEKDDNHLALYGPYLGRSLIELSYTSLVARMDPLRALIIKGNQSRSGYELDRPQKSSLRWQGDVMAKKALKEDAMWGDKSEDPTRAIFGVYNVELVLKKSAKDMLDCINERPGFELASDFQEHDEKSLVEMLKTKSNSLYSFLSKGIHHELLVDLSSALDRDTVVSRLNEVLFLVAASGFLVSFVPHSYNNLEQSLVLDLYSSARSIEVS